MTPDLMPNQLPELRTFQLTAMGCVIQISLNISRLNDMNSLSSKSNINSVNQHTTPFDIEHYIDYLRADIQHQLLRWTRIFSRFDANSELMRLNQRATTALGKQQRSDQHSTPWVTVSADLFAVLQRSLDFVPKTQGLVTPTLLPLLCAAGYQDSFETFAKLSSTALLNPALPNLTAANHKQNNASMHSSRYQADRIQLRTSADGQHHVSLPAGMALDLNGYVKGWCAMQLAAQISGHISNSAEVQDNKKPRKKSGACNRIKDSNQVPWQQQQPCRSFPCLVDMGGDMAIGTPTSVRRQADDYEWGIAIAKPYRADKSPTQNTEDIAVLALRSGAVATSGQDYRRWWHQGAWQHHLIDPKQQRPSSSDVLSATILAADAMTAEVYAKYCVLLGSTAALAWMQDQGVAGLLIDCNDQLIVSTAMSPYLVALS